MNSDVSLGAALVDRDVLEGLERLWMGDFGPAYLRKAELALRAFLVAPTLIASRLTGSVSDDFLASGGGTIEDPAKPFIMYEAPFSDHLLDYEFIYPREPHPYKELATEEALTLQLFVATRIEETVQAIFPKWIATRHEADAFLDAWYRGNSLHDCERAASHVFDDLDDSFHRYGGRNEKLAPDYLFTASSTAEVIRRHRVFGSNPGGHAQYLVGCHRAGLLVFGDSPIAQICEEHVFTAWPQRLFQILGDDFKEQSRLVSGPEVAFGLPPLLSIVLGRASRRVNIPREISEMREEYAPARIELWSLLRRMWSAESFSTQVKLARSLESAARSIIPAAFKSKVNAIELAIDAASVDLGSIAKTLLTYDQANRRVGAISFARRLSHDVRQFATSHHAGLRRHLSNVELAEFGLA